MEFTAAHIITLFIFVFGLFTALVGIIWRQNANWIKSIELRAAEDRQRFFAHEEKQDKTTARLFAEITKVQGLLADYTTGEADRFQRCLTQFQSRRECERIHSK